VVPCLWSRDGQLIYVWARGAEGRGYSAVRVSDGEAAALLQGGMASRQLGIAMASDGERLLFPVWERLSDLWIAEMHPGGSR
jgi:hypothetical protein